jgi:hypothetical protein
LTKDKAKENNNLEQKEYDVNHIPKNPHAATCKINCRNIMTAVKLDCHELSIACKISIP